MGDSLAARLFEFAEEEPERVAVHLLRSDARGGFRDEKVTLRAWIRGALACAAALRGHGLGRGDRVLLCMPTGRRFLEAFLGTQALGAIPVPLPSLEGFIRPSAFADRLESVVRDAAPAAVFADARTATHLRRSQLIGADLPVVDPSAFGSRPSLRPELATGDETALIQYTSGSTATPRGVVITAANLMANATAMGKALEVTRADHLVSWLPLYHDMGLIGALLAPLAHRATVWLLSPIEFMLRPASWLRAVSQARASLTVAPNFAYGLVARKVSDDEVRGVDLSSLKAAINGAEPVDPATAELFCVRFAPFGLRPSAYFPVYGLAEATLSVSFPPLRRGLKVEHVRRDRLAEGHAEPGEPGPETMPIVSVGSAIDGHEIAIVDPQTHAPLPDRRVGEIRVSGPSVSPWYFEGHQAARSRRRSLRTGDAGYLADGELYVVDRLKDLVIIGGRNYSPSDIERAAETIAGVRAGRTVAFGVPDASAGTESLVVVAEVQPRTDLELGALGEAIRGRVLDRIGVGPADVVLVRPGALSRTSSGKLMRRDTRKRYLAGSLQSERAVRRLFALRLVEATRGVLLRFLARRRASQG